MQKALCFCLAVTLHVAAFAVPNEGLAQERDRILVVDLKLEQGVQESVARLLNEVLLSEVQSQVGANYEIFGQADLTSMVELEQTRQAAGCDDDVFCLAEVGGALGAKYTMFGTVGAIGDLYVLSLKLINVQEGRVMGRWSESVDGNPEKMVPALKRGVSKVAKPIITNSQPPIDEATAAAKPTKDAADPAAQVDLFPEPKAQPQNNAKITESVESEESDSIVTKWWFWTAIGVVAAGATVGIVLATRGGSDNGPAQTSTSFDVVLPAR